MNTTSTKQFICFRKRDLYCKKIICFPPAGSGASFYSKWFKKLPENIEIWALQLPNREFLIEQEFPISFNEYIKKISQEIIEIIDENTTFYGHSFGAALAFFTASAIERENHKIENLIVSARKNISTQYSPKLSTLSDGELISYIKKLGGGNHPFLEDNDTRQRFLSLLRNDLQLNESTDKEYLPIETPINFLYASNDIALTEEDARMWKMMTKKNFTLHNVEGNHFFVNQIDHPCYTIIKNILMKSTLP